MTSAIHQPPELQIDTGKEYLRYGEALNRSFLDESSYDVAPDRRTDLEGRSCSN
jgi:hypothetical protein